MSGFYSLFHRAFPLSKLEERFFKGKALGPEEVIKNVERDLNL